ncbi:methylated-DNA--[protein]-cysteine S-methyltransferase [Dickeya fangzhongdai]|uniref:methylated-DNA--[protein]-cysteine S-methyltransferase n=1 Tax=Dickeya fangzhongdai TaxID=1778540 RepID=UPI0026E08CB2|nr:methylated-DNA--[protein]-cysteine S-methyltransferase [Dickeya fangzhongdai]WKV49570.1 methylated-DNA--[protein]-cysteine S-methyltransferase [Dickeya fangzhongdai]
MKKHPVEENRVKMATQQLDCPDSFPWRYADVTAADGCVTSVLFSNEQKPTRPDAVTQACCQQLQAYFAGQRTTFNLPLHQDATPFRRQVYARLLDIGYGVTRTYQQIAAAVGNPNGSRAVGMASSKNQISIIVPCHRVIATSGALTGYAGGLATKQWLLEHERRYAVSTATTSATIGAGADADAAPAGNRPL